MIIQNEELINFVFNHCTVLARGNAEGQYTDFEGHYYRPRSHNRAIITDREHITGPIQNEELINFVFNHCTILLFTPAIKRCK
jgi:hypothetical protein